MRRSAGLAALCSAPMSKRGRPSMVGGPNGSRWVLLSWTQDSIWARMAASSAGVTASGTTR